MREGALEAGKMREEGIVCNVYPGNAGGVGSG
jgi:hypothetical protein